MKSLRWLFYCLLVLGHADGVTVNETTLPDSGFADLETSKHIEIVPLDLTKAASRRNQMSLCDVWEVVSLAENL